MIKIINKVDYFLIINHVKLFIMVLSSIAKNIQAISSHATWTAYWGRGEWESICNLQNEKQKKLYENVHKIFVCLIQQIILLFIVNLYA